MSQTINKPFSPGVLSMLPLFYVGWSDSVLSPSEMKLIHNRLKELDFLSKSDYEYLIKYSDPTNPPSEEVFDSWVNAIKSIANDIDIEKKNSLVDLGLEIAKASINYNADEMWKSPRTKQSLCEIEEALGLDCGSSHMILLNNITENPKPEDSSFDPLLMLKTLDGKHEEVNTKMRKLLRDPFFAYTDVRNKEEYRMLVLKQLKELAKQGLSAYAFPKEYGGQEKYGDHIAVFEMLGLHDLSLTVKFGVQFGLFGGAIMGLGTEQHHRKFLEPMFKTDLLGCFAMTETNHGSNVKGLETTATYSPEDDTIIINTPHQNASKEYIGNAMHSSMAAVFAQLIVNGEHHGVHCILVPIRDKDGNLLAGIKVRDCGYKMGLNGVDNGMFWFEKVKVPRNNLLNRFGGITEDGVYKSEIENPNKRFFTMLGALVTGRVSVGLAGVSASKTALTIAIKYGLKRRQFAPDDKSPETIIMDYPTHQHRLFPLLAKTYAYHFALHDLVDEMVNTPKGGDFRIIETKAAGLKSLATWHTTQTIQECREACGGKGYLDENRLSDLKADTDIFTTFEGDNTVLLQLVAKGVLTDFRKSFGEDSISIAMNYLSNQISLKINEFNPIYANRVNSNHLLNPKFHIHAFEYHEEKLLMTVTQRMKNYLSKKLSPNDAFLKCQVHLIALGKAYTNRLTLQSFQNAVDKCQDPKIKDVLSLLCQLYALWTIEENKGFYLENDYINGTKSKAIRRVIAKLMQKLRPQASSIIDGFGIPEELLGAKIILYN